MALNYVYEKAKDVANVVIGRKLTLCYVRVRCPCCGMWVRLDNLKRDQPLFEESTTYSGGRAVLFHDKKTNSSLKPFWISRLKYVLARLGVVERPYEFEKELAYTYGSVVGHASNVAYSLEKGVSYGYER